jgi:hypothetical protein
MRGNRTGSYINSLQAVLLTNVMHWVLFKKPAVVWNLTVRSRVHKSPEYSLSYGRWIHSTILTLPLRVIRSLPGGLLSSGFPAKSVFTKLSHACYMSYPSNPLDLIIAIISGEYRKLEVPHYAELLHPEEWVTGTRPSGNIWLESLLAHRLVRLWLRIWPSVKLLWTR